MSVAFIMLVHTALGRAAQVARHWAERGCPVVIHVDRRVRRGEMAGLRRRLGDLDNVRFCRRHRVRWGTWSVVAATQDAAETALGAFPDARHIFLASGSCLPLRPVAELSAYLDAHADTDFIESVTTADVPWTVGGLSIERFTLRFPFSWREQRKLFDRYVALQRRVGFRRRIPPGVVPHLGSQWWCLTRRTLEAILTDPERPGHDRYFRRVWIPDESYFQTLARHHGRRIESRSLTLTKFDFQGKPHLFYDDHLQLLRRSGFFMARKIWPRAERLYATFLSDDPAPIQAGEPDPGKIDRLFTKATERRTRGRPGLHMQSRFPNDGWENGKTAHRYSVFEGFDAVIRDFEGWLSRALGARVHGHLYAPDRAHFAGGARLYHGGLSDSATLRDYNPNGFLTALIWNLRDERQCFQFGPGDNQEISWLIASDPNAQVSVVTGAWAAELFAEGAPFAEARARAAQLQRVEAAHLDILRRPDTRARVRIWSLAEFLREPMEPLQTILGEIAPRTPPHLIEAPSLRDLSGFGDFLQALRNEGMQPHLVGDVTPDAGGQAPPRRPARPRIAR